MSLPRESLRRSVRLAVVILATGLLLAGANCRHARIRLAPPAPAACAEPRIDEAACKAALAGQPKAPPKGAKKTLEQKFWLWGFWPRRIEYRAADLCPNGVYEIYQYSSWKDGIWAELSFGFYLPRTLEVTCY